MKADFNINRKVGWVSLVVGAVTGLIMGLWSFDGPVSVPQVVGDYDALSRRLIRLGHIACFGLGILNILIARELPQAALADNTKKLASRAMNFGNIFLPTTLFAGATIRPAKYLMSFPAVAITVALIITAYGLLRGGSSSDGCP